MFPDGSCPISEAWDIGFASQEHSPISTDVQSLDFAFQFQHSHERLDSMYVRTITLGS
jgi:hypothetical protein